MGGLLGVEGWFNIGGLVEEGEADETGCTLGMGNEGGGV